MLLECPSSYKSPNVFFDERILLSRISCVSAENTCHKVVKTLGTVAGHAGSPFQGQTFLLLPGEQTVTQPKWQSKVSMSVTL